MESYLVHGYGKSEAWPKTAEALYNAIQSALTGKATAQAALETAKADYLS